MSTLTSEEKLKKIVILVDLHNITAYEIAKNTTISEAGVGKILNKLSKKPHINSVNAIYNYVIKYENAPIDYTNEKEFSPAINKTNYATILTKVENLIKNLEAIKDPDVNILKELKAAYDLRADLSTSK